MPQKPTAFYSTYAMDALWRGLSMFLIILYTAFMLLLPWMPSLVGSGLPMCLLIH